MAELSERERITLLMMRGWGDQQRGYKSVQQLFNENFWGRNNRISKTTVVRTIQRFDDTRSVKDRPRSGRRKTATNNNKALEVLQSFGTLSGSCLNWPDTHSVCFFFLFFSSLLWPSRLNWPDPHSVCFFFLFFLVCCDHLALTGRIHTVFFLF